MASIRDLLSVAAQAATTNDIYMFDNTYSEQSLTGSDGSVLAGGGGVSITYVKVPGTNPGYFSAVSTKYTQSEQPFIPKAGADDVTGDVINSKAYGGGFKIEDRPLIGSDGSDDTTTTTITTTSGNTSSY